jgi:hypothetical protein
MRRPIAALLLGLAASVPATELDLSVPRDAARPSAQRCDSVVQRSCRPADASAAADAATAAGALRELEQRRAAPDLDRQLEAVVIEGERQRRPPTVREAIEAATATRTARSFESGDGGQCTCIKPCPAWPAPCCPCTKGGRDAMINNLIR